MRRSCLWALRHAVHTSVAPGFTGSDGLSAPAFLASHPQLHRVPAYCAPGGMGTLLGSTGSRVRTLRSKLSTGRQGGLQLSARPDGVTRDVRGGPPPIRRWPRPGYHGSRPSTQALRGARSLCLRAPRDYWVNAMDAIPSRGVNRRSGLLRPGAVDHPALERDGAARATPENWSPIRCPSLHRGLDRECYSPAPRP